MELIEGIQNFVTVVYHLRYIIGFVIVVGFSLSAWGWWNNITV
jgi:hypothetical protein